MSFQIVLAWTENTKLVPTGRYVMRDLKWFPEWKSELEGKAVMWMRKGSDKDLAKARAHAAAENKMVFTFPINERNPLERARQMALSA